MKAWVRLALAAGIVLGLLFTLAHKLSCFRWIAMELAGSKKKLHPTYLQSGPFPGLHSMPLSLCLQNRLFSIVH